MERRIMQHLTTDEWARFKALAHGLGLTPRQALLQIHLDRPEADGAGLIGGGVQGSEHPRLALAGRF